MPTKALHYRSVDRKQDWERARERAKKLDEEELESRKRMKEEGSAVLAEFDADANGELQAAEVRALLQKFASEEGFDDPIITDSVYKKMVGFAS